MKHKVLGFTFGDVNDKISWSGIHYRFYAALKKRATVVAVINSKCRIPRLERKMSGKQYDPNAVLEYFYESSKICARQMAQVRMPYDFILQSGMSPGIRHVKPFFVYLDRTSKQWFREYGDYPFYKNPAIDDTRQKETFMELEGSIYKAAKALFTFSNYARNSLILDYHIPPEKVITVGAGPNITTFPETKGEFDGKTILFIGVNFLRKGGVVLLKAFKKVKETVPDAKLIIVSSQFKETIPYEDLKNLAKFGITVKGYVEKVHAARLFRKASVFVMPSLYEAYGLVFLEAMGYGLPCIGTNVCAIPEIIDDGKNGFLVRPHDHIHLAEKITYLLKHTAAAKRMGKCGHRKIIPYFTWDQVTKRMLRHIEHSLIKL